MEMTHRFTTCPVGGNYAEASYFDGYAFQHIAEYHEHKRMKRIHGDARRMIARRANGRGIRP